MEARIQILLILFTVALLGVVVELVRRKRLLEKYALLWILAALVLVGLAVWRDLLEELASLVGIYYAPSALFVTAFGFVLILLLHFSLVVSRLTDQNKVLAQHLGLLREEVDRLKHPESAVDLTPEEREPGAHERSEHAVVRAGPVGDRR